MGRLGVFIPVSDAGRNAVFLHEASILTPVYRAPPIPTDALPHDSFSFPSFLPPSSILLHPFIPRHTYHTCSYCKNRHLTREKRPLSYTRLTKVLLATEKAERERKVEVGRIETFINHDKKVTWAPGTAFQAAGNSRYVVLSILLFYMLSHDHFNSM